MGQGKVERRQEKVKISEVEKVNASSRPDAESYKLGIMSIIFVTNSLVTFFLIASF
jgi:hypothetical protein